jgi:N-hydroxyarylamine O-acetyltransferase
VADLDLDGYLARIDWRGATTPTLATLTGLLRAHMSAIPFENLDVLLGRGIRIDLAAIEAKLVRARRGGYCFEHTTLFAAALEALGFVPLRHSARVLLVAPRTQAPRTHMFLTVTLDEGRFVLDPGFGGPAPEVPIALVDRAEAGDAEAKHWMVRDGDFWLLQTRTGDKSFSAWASTLEEDHPIDFEMANHFTATHPSSQFRNRLMMSIFTKDGRVTVLNRDANIRRGDRLHAMQLADRSALRRFVVEHFGFDEPEIEHLHLPFIPEWG